MTDIDKISESCDCGNCPDCHRVMYGASDDPCPDDWDTDDD